MYPAEVEQLEIDAVVVRRQDFFPVWSKETALAMAWTFLN